MPTPPPSFAIVLVVFLASASERGTVQGNVATLDSYEIASELSFLLTDSMPDDALFEAADQGKL